MTDVFKISLICERIQPRVPSTMQDVHRNSVICKYMQPLRQHKTSIQHSTCIWHVLDS
jgi:hypothetical protein